MKHNRLSRINIVGGPSPGRNSTEETEEHSDSLTVGLTPRVPYSRKKTSGDAHAFLAGRVETLAAWYVSGYRRNTALKAGARTQETLPSFIMPLYGFFSSTAGAAVCGRGVCSAGCGLGATHDVKSKPSLADILTQSDS